MQTDVSFLSTAKIIHHDLGHRHQAASGGEHSFHSLHAALMTLDALFQLRQSPFLTEAHISNFLNRKRALSLEGLDRVLASQNLTIDQILPLDLAAAATPQEQEPIDTVPVVSSSVAMDEPRVAESAVIETVQVSASRLHDNRARPSTKHAHWQRFVAIRADAQQSAAMQPVLARGAIAVLDRHYNSLAPYRSQQPTLYAVRCGAALVLRYVDFDDGRLILRPYARDFPVQLVPLASHESPADYIVGRVCLIFSEL